MTVARSTRRPLDATGREKLLRYVLRPPLAQERLESRPDGLVRIVLERGYADGTLAVEMDPVSLLCRLAIGGSRRQPFPRHPRAFDTPVDACFACALSAGARPQRGSPQPGE